MPAREAWLYFALITAGILILTALSLIWLFDHFEKTQNPGSFVAAPFAGPRTLPPPPRIQPNPGVDMQSYRESQQNFLNHLRLDRPPKRGSCACLSIGLWS